MTERQEIVGIVNIFCLAHRKKKQGTRCPAEQTELRLYLAAGSSARLRD